MKEKRRFINIILLTLIIAVLLSVYAFLCSCGVVIPCVFYKITGLYCPGCGNTRAALAFLRFDFSAMLHYNLMFLPEILYVAMVYLVSAGNYIKNNKFSYRSPCKAIDWIFLILLLLWAVIRNVLPIFSLS